MHRCMSSNVIPNVLTAIIMKQKHFILTSVAYKISSIFCIKGCVSPSSASWQLKIKRAKNAAIFSIFVCKSNCKYSQNLYVAQFREIEISFFLQAFQIQTHIHNLKQLKMKQSSITPTAPANQEHTWLDNSSIC